MVDGRHFEYGIVLYLGIGSSELHQIWHEYADLLYKLCQLFKFDNFIQIQDGGAAILEDMQI